MPTMWTRIAAAATLVTASTAGRPGGMPPPLNKADILDAGGDWVSLEEGLEFQGNPRVLEEFESSSSSMKDPYDRIFVDGADTYYDEYSQAWRVLGWYIDCDDCPQENGYGDDGEDAGADANANDNSDGSRNSFCRGVNPQNPYLQQQYYNYNNNNNGEDDNDRRRQRRRLEEEEDYVADDDDDGVADEAQDQVISSNGARAQCSRVLLWAAYVDLNYDGNQNTEYQYFNRKSNSWDTSLCLGSSSRCAKMDCHLPQSNFNLLGIYKDRRSDFWMSQLFDKQGDCIWSDEEYSFMNYAGRNNNLVLPSGCTRSNRYVNEMWGSNNGLPLYYDIKPAMYGRIGVGIYVDSDCVVPYKGSVTPEEMLVSEGKYTIPYDSDGNATSTLQEDLETWNDAFDAFKICQPCKAYDITQAVVSNGFQRNYNNKRFGSSSGKSSCSESASPNFNQCKLFVRGGYSVTATYSEVEQAGEQGSIAGIQVNGVAFGKTNKEMSWAPLEAMFAWVVLIGTLVLFAGAFVSLMHARVAANRALSTTLREPLVPSNGALA